MSQAYLTLGDWSSLTVEELMELGVSNNFTCLEPLLPLTIVKLAHSAPEIIYTLPWKQFTLCPGNNLHSCTNCYNPKDQQLKNV